MARAKRARKATVEATAMPALKAVVCVAGSGRVGADEIAVAAAAFGAEEDEVVVLVDTGAGEQEPNASWHPASQYEELPPQ